MALVVASSTLSAGRWRARDRWLVATAAVVMQVALGAVYAWSVFQTPLVEAFGWSVSQVTLTFTLTILFLGLAAYPGGLWLAAVGPRVVGVVAGLLYGGGVFLASFAGERLGVLYLTYGLLGGAGIGLGYIVPVATLVKWFPDRRGLLTGVAVGGFGAGALLTAPLATWLLGTVGVAPTFRILGLTALVLVGGAALLLRNPPDGFVPLGWPDPGDQAAPGPAPNATLAQALRTRQWYALWALLFLNATAGIALLSQAAPMARELTGVDAPTAASLVGLLAVANATGRIAWAGLSDAWGRRQVFFLLFLLQALLFAALPLVGGFAAFALLTNLILLCYGGGFGTMPAFVADAFGARHVGTVYGLLLTAWAAAGVVGPLLIAGVRETTGTYSPALAILAASMLLSASIPLRLRSQRSPTGGGA
jgi:MFS transporter, OFA family, oxalate/formate antiporter